jgi:RimJ/RimL family protein N-acetyltransferase
MHNQVGKIDEIHIREISVADAAGFLGLCQRLDNETTFMLLEPGERKTTLRQQEQRIQSILGRGNQNILVAVDGKMLVGYIAGLGGNYRRNQHKAEVVVGVLEAYSGQGLGAQLFERLEDWARQQKIHKLELSVMAHNQRAIRLYKKMGFMVEGVSADSLRVDGSYVDELDMAKIIDR